MLIMRLEEKLDGNSTKNATCYSELILEATIIAKITREY